MTTSIIKILHDCSMSVPMNQSKTQTCQHEFLEEETCRICELCGLEIEIIQNDNQTFGNLGTVKSCSSYSIKLPQDEYDKYLNDVPELKPKIMTMFEKVDKIVNLRGDGKKAILAAVYFYVYSETGITTTKDVAAKFGLEKRKFSRGTHEVLNVYPVYRTMTKKISDYVDLIFSKFPKFPIEYKEEALIKAKQVDNYSSFINQNPHAVCACVVFKLLTEKGQMKIKKNAYIKEIGMSDVTVQKINNHLKNI